MMVVMSRLYWIVTSVVFVISLTRIRHVEPFAPPVRTTTTTTTIKNSGHYLFRKNKENGTNVNGDTNTKKPTNAVSNNNNNNNNNNIPGYNFFQGDGTGYVPSGMSKTEYEQLRQREIADEASKNYGAWGPNFLPQSNVRPDGDWMVMPSLWTNGFGFNDDGYDDDPMKRQRRQRQQINGAANDNQSILNKIRRIVFVTSSLVKANFAGFVLGYLLVDTLTSCYFMWKIQQLTPRTIIMKILNTVIWNQFQQRHPALARGFLGRWFTPPSAAPIAQSTTPASILLQVYMIKSCVAIAFTPFMNLWIERQNRKKLWTKRKTVLVTIFVQALVIMLWGGMLNCLPR